MRKCLWFSVCALLVIQAVAAVSSPSARAATNFIANPSVETGGAIPTNWSHDKWGSLTATFAYKKNEGYQSARSVRVNVTNYKSGDAKWEFTPVAVQPNTEYVFSNHYKASVKTKIVAVSYDASNMPTYFDIATDIVASKTTWKKATAKVKTLATTKKLGILHLIERNGWLQLDTASLIKNETVPPPPVNFAPNPSLEQAAGTPPVPISWQTESWGTNTPKFEYVNEGHTGTRSVKVTVSGYQDGDAKWAFEPQPLERGKEYRFSAWYKTNTAPQVVARYIKDNGTEEYFGLPRPEPDGTTNWQQYSDTFSVPQDAKAVTVFFFITGNGWVQTDDYKIEPHQVVGFDRPLVSLTFDDGFEENVQTVLPKLSSHGFKSTQCYATQYIEGVAGQPENVLQFKNAGHEVCSHTVSHPELTTLQPSQLTYELTHSKQYLESVVNMPVTTFASPYGAYDATVNNEIKKYYRSHRTTDEGFNSKDNFNPYRIRVQNMKSTTTLAEYQEWLAKAKADKTWLVLVYHRVTPIDPGEFDTFEGDFTQQMNALSASGMTVKTYTAALDELTPQL